MVTPQKIFYILTPESVMVNLFGKRVFADTVKDLKMRSSWIREGPKFNDKCHKKGEEY